MNFKEWKDWQASIPWSIRWFIYLIILRPIIDKFYYLKDISPLISPLNIVGVLTPLLCLLAVYKYKKKNVIMADLYFKYWSLLTLFSGFFIFIVYGLNLFSLQIYLKVTTIVFLFLFARIFIQTKQDLLGLLQTFKYSCIYVIFMFFFQLFFGGGNVEVTRDTTRDQGPFADFMNFATYITIGFLIIGYEFLLKRDVNKKKSSKKFYFIIFIFLICMVALFRLKHVATFAVFFSIVFLLFYETSKSAKGIMIILGFFLFVFYLLFGEQVYNNAIEPLIKNEVEISEGEREQSQFMHGRWGRWQNMTTEYKNSSLLAIFVGMPYDLSDFVLYITIAVHNDFLRILFFTGIIGLAFYLLFLINLFSRLKYLKVPEHFLAVGAFLVLLIFSISMLPTMYPTMMYIVVSIFAYLCLPKEYLKLN